MTDRFFLDEICSMMEVVSLEEVPLQVLQDGDRMLGVLPEKLKRLWAVVHRMDEEAKAMDDLLNEAGGTEMTWSEANGLILRQQRARIRQEGAVGLFWDSVQLACPEVIGEDAMWNVRQGWQLVIMDPELELRRATLNNLGIVIVPEKLPSDG